MYTSKCLYRKTRALNDNFKQNIDKSLSACDFIKNTKTTKTAMLYYTSTPFEMDEHHLHSPRGDHAGASPVSTYYNYTQRLWKSSPAVLVKIRFFKSLKTRKILWRNYGILSLKTAKNTNDNTY